MAKLPRGGPAVRVDVNVSAFRRFAKRERWRSVAGKGGRGRIRAHEIRELYESYR